MAIESKQVESKLAEEGVDVKFAEGASFETEEELGKWVNNIKTLSVKPKAIEDYTADELEALLKEPQPKAKGLQALTDKIRAAKKKEAADDGKKPKEDGHTEKDEVLEKITALQKQIEDEKKERETEKKTHTFEETFSKHAKGLEDADKKYVKATLNLDASEEDIKKAVSDYKAMMAKRGFKGFGTGGSVDDGKNSGLPSGYKSYIHSYTESKTKKK